MTAWTTERARARRSEPSDPGAVLLVAAVAALTALLVASRVSTAGTASITSPLDDAGPVTELLLPVVRLAWDVLGIAAVAVLLATRVLAPGHRERSVRPWAVTWGVAAVAAALLTASDVSATSVDRMLSGGLVVDYAWSVPQARALLVSAALALLAAAVTRRARGTRGAAVLLGLVGAALVAPVLTGHAASAGAHVVAVAAVAGHVLAASCWVGGLAGLALLRGADPRALAVGVPRFSRLAVGCFLVVAVSGAVAAWTRLEDLTSLWTTAYGWLLLGKVTALAVLGAVGLRHRRRTVAAAAAGRPRAFLLLAATEIAVMAATVGLAVALSRTPTPAHDVHAGAATVSGALDTGRT